MNSSMLAEKIALSGKTAVYIKDFESIVELLDKNVKSGDLVITMGAGDVYKVGDMFLEAGKARSELRLIRLVSLLSSLQSGSHPQLPFCHPRPP